MDEGDIAPDFRLKDSNQSHVRLSDFRGEYVILYFYPKDNTPGCTIEAVEFSFLRDEFREYGAHIIGVSRDSCESHQKFVDDKKLTITLLSDPDASVQKQYGVWGQKKMMGNTFMGAIRSTYLISPEGKILRKWHKVISKGHAEKVLEQLRKISSKEFGQG
jgi:thioredoxin-dependent peroxiredoxin